MPKFETKRPQREIWKREWFLLAIFGGVFLAFELSGMFQFSPGAFFLQPGMRVIDAMSEGEQTLGYWWKFWTTGAQRIELLEKQVAKDTRETAQVTELQRENAALRAALKIETDGNWLRSRWYGFSHHWYVDVGCKDGLQKGNEVTFEGSLVGILDTVYEHQSLVLALDDPDLRLPVRVGTASAQGVLSSSSGFPQVKEVFTRFPVVAGDLVVTSGQGSGLSGVPVAVVKQVREEKGFGTYTIDAEPLVQAYHPRFVEVFRFGGGKESCLED